MYHSKTLSTLSQEEQSDRLTGRVAWKFGGATCYGDMIPGNETSAFLPLILSCIFVTHNFPALFGSILFSILSFFGDRSFGVR